jgi:hypothetical protein
MCGRSGDEGSQTIVTPNVVAIIRDKACNILRFFGGLGSVSKIGRKLL